MYLILLGRGYFCQWIHWSSARAHKEDVISFENIEAAIIMGSAMASFVLKNLSTERLKEISIKI